MGVSLQDLRYSLRALRRQPMFVLIDPARLYVEAAVDEVDSGELETGLEVRVMLDPFRGESFAGRIVRVAPHVTEALEENRTVTVEVAFDTSVDMRRVYDPCVPCSARESR